MHEFPRGGSHCNRINVRVNHKIKIYKIIIVYVNIIQITVLDFLCFDFGMSVLIDYPLVSKYS